MNKFYLSTAIAYVNAPPHVGHALEFIQADALARYYRLKGVDTFFLTGTDEHGVKVFETAEKAAAGAGCPTEEEVQAFVDRHAEQYKALEGILNLTNDDFIRTSSARHKAGARKIWTKMFEKGDIYMDVYKGNYCVGCEAFIRDKDLDEEGNCPNHKKKPEILEEENYFFRLSKYSDAIRDAIESGKLKILPESRKNEMLGLIGEEGLKDVSFSRPKEVLPWGVDVPGDDSQVMYVWCDALSNYITAMDYENEGERFQKYWPCDAHIIGKDILRFHAGVWIGMLLAAEVAIPKAVYVHGFVTSEGQKMSKSLGNVVDPLEYTEKYGIDCVRYYLLREIPTTDDGDFSHQRFVDLCNSELANGLGNLVNRVTMMTERYCDGKVPEVELAEQMEFPEIDEYKEAFEGYDIKKACEVIVGIVNRANKFIDDEKPWAVVKEGGSVDLIIRPLLDILSYIAVMLYPILPGTAEKIAGQIGIDVADFSLDGGMLKSGGVVVSGGVLFPRIEEEED